MKHRVKTSEGFDNFDSSCTDDESENGQSSAVSHNDQDSDVSFESENDEEIDAEEIEEGDLVNYIISNEAIETRRYDAGRRHKK